METLTFDELIAWLTKLRKSQEGFIPTNVTNITVRDSSDKGRGILIETVEELKLLQQIDDLQ